MKIIVFILLSVAMLPLCGGWHAVQISWSDGVQEECQIEKMGEEIIVINCHPEKRMPDEKIPLSEITSIAMSIRNSSMNQPWMWKESGKTDKVYFGEAYPFIDLSTTLTLIDGRILKGNIISCAFRCRMGRQKKVFLAKQYKGHPGEQLSAALYPTRILFRERKPTAPSSLSGTVTGWGRLQEVTACEISRRQVFTAVVEGDAFHFDALPSKPVMIIIRTDSALLCGFPHGSTIPDSIRLFERQADDFFKERFILAFHNNCMLIYKRRSDFYDSDTITRGGFVWHLELWYWHTPVENEWKLDARSILMRHIQKGDEALRKLTFVPSLINVMPNTVVSITAETPHELEFPVK